MLIATKERNLVLFLLFSLCFLCFSCCQARDSNQHPNNYKSGTASTADASAITANQKTKKQNESAEDKLFSWLSNLVDFRLTDAFLVIFTLVLAIKTSGLYTETAALRAIQDEQRSDMLRSVKATEIAAAAAMKSADIAERSLSELERPWLFLEGAVVKIRDESKPNSWVVIYNWSNVGRSPAIIQKSIAIVANKKILEPMPDYRKMANNLAFRKTLPAGEFAFTAEIGLDPTEWDSEQKIAYGFIEYKGMGGAIYTSGFALEISINEEKFSLYANENYTYYT